jgi:hypothetical protein
MQKSSRKYLKTKFNSISERSYNMMGWVHSRDLRMGQHMQINKHNIPHKYSEGWKSHDHLNKCRKRP